ncbi:MAG: T9SS type A sorting domain-containing protein [Chitinispirillales bacterium]|jgi:hypothetical protein|nr:T9SS type A sorting domain-containing protein [Chitinispirillales bacterium]
MKNVFIVFLLATLIFAQENPVFVPEEMTDDAYFSDESEINTAELGLFEIDGNIGDGSILQNLVSTGSQSEILFSINNISKTIICDFPVDFEEEKVIEIVSVYGLSIMEMLTAFSQKSINIPTDKLPKGIYIIRILSKETQKSILSKAFVVG